LFLEQIYHEVDENLISMQSSTKLFCHNNKDIMFTRADKNITVALDRDDYVKK